MNRRTSDHPCRTDAAAIIGADHHSGFTLIELLVVVAIIALLISILLPSLARARDEAKTIKCMANMRELSTATQTFAMNNGSRFQLVTSVSPGVRLVDWGSKIFKYSDPATHQLLAWPIILLQEMQVRSLQKNTDWGVFSTKAAEANVDRTRMKRFEILVCPSDQYEISTTFYPEIGSSSDPQRLYGYLSYGINEDIVGAPSTVGVSTPVWKEGSKRAGERLEGKLDKVVQPATVAMFTDMGLSAPLGSAAAQRCNLLTTDDCSGPFLENVESRWGRLPTQRHRGGGLCVVYADCHAGFARKVKRTGAIPTGQPDWIYAPKTRVSPYTP
jgi:prepilin-type N-terminal cleavage/methylation domain-containing protein